MLLADINVVSEIPTWQAGSNWNCWISWFRVDSVYNSVSTNNELTSQNYIAEEGSRNKLPVNRKRYVPFLCYFPCKALLLHWVRMSKDEGDSDFCPPMVHPLLQVHSLCPNIPTSFNSCLLKLQQSIGHNLKYTRWLSIHSSLTENFKRYTTPKKQTSAKLMIWGGTETQQ